MIKSSTENEQVVDFFKKTSSIENKRLYRLTSFIPERKFNVKVITPTCWSINSFNNDSAFIGLIMDSRLMMQISHKHPHTDKEGWPIMFPLPLICSEGHHGGCSFDLLCFVMAQLVCSGSSGVNHRWTDLTWNWRLSIPK